MNNFNKLILIKKLHHKPMIRNQAALYLNALNDSTDKTDVRLEREVEKFINENKV